jgi:glycolate oxidase FAD binding subunit
VPKPEKTATLIWSGLDDLRAVALMSQGLGSPFEVSAAAFVPQKDGQPSQTLLRLENFAASLAYRIDRLARELQSFGKPDTLETDASLGLWTSIRDAAPLHGVDGAIWRISVAPSRAPSFLRAVASETIRHFLDWGGGLIWLATPESDVVAKAVQNAARAVGGHATLVHAAPLLRSSFAFMPPSSAGLGRLTARVREAMDPHAILNPGRMGV